MRPGSWQIKVALILGAGLLPNSQAAALDAEAFEDLPVPGYLAAVVSVPRGAAGRRPVIVATHGSFDRPEWQCASWQQIVGDAAFVLCPRGLLRWDSPKEPWLKRYYYKQGSQALGSEVRAGLDALRARYPDRVADGPVIYTGFSQGAIQGAPIVLKGAQRFPRAVFIEGGHGTWTREGARAYAAGGGQRVLFSCGRPYCMKGAKAAAANLEAAGIKVKVVSAGNVGHTYDGAVQEQTRGAFAWLVEGDPRYAGR